MYDTVRCLFLSSTITLFANVPEIFEYPMEKLGFGAILFFIIWTYMKSILPKTHEELQKLRDENRKLVEEISKLNQLRERDQKLIALHLREIKELAETHLGNSGIRKTLRHRIRTTETNFKRDIIMTSLPQRLTSTLYEYIWGGRKLASKYGKGDGIHTRIAESWENCETLENSSIILKWIDTDLPTSVHVPDVPV